MPGDGDPPPSKNRKKQDQKKTEKPKALDLFTGTGSVANRLRDLGYEVTTLDVNPRVHADITENILHWNYCKYPTK